MLDTSSIRRLFDRAAAQTDTRLWPRWIVLRGLGLIYSSVFYSLAFQIHGLIGERGILPAHEFLAELKLHFGAQRFLLAPTLLWLSSENGALTALVVTGALGSIALTFNLWPRASLGVSGLAFASFIGAAQDFASYQSDGMLLEATLVGFFFAPRGLRPGLGAEQPPSRASLFLMQWLWFRIYFESGLAKIRSGDPAWRALTAMDHYYENGPLPSWLGYYVQQGLPHWVHAASAAFTLALELPLIWLAAFPRRWRIALFWMTSALQLGIILTANYAFLNYFVLLFGVLLVDDDFFRALPKPTPVERRATPRWLVATSAVLLGWHFYATCVAELRPLPRPLVMLALPLHALRLGNRYGLFAVMTPERREIEFQGTLDGEHWLAYPFRYKPQRLDEPPKLFAPYQPRFDWNLWFSSLEPGEDNVLVLSTEERLLANEPSVLGLFAGNPFSAQAPRRVRAMLYRYRFTSLAEHRATGNFWAREQLGLYTQPVP